MRYVMLVCANKGVEYAISVRRRKGTVLVTDGPFAETREWIGGRAPTSTRPSIAAKNPMAHFGRIEVRPCCPEK